MDDLRPPCPFYVLGRCKFGDYCTNSHERAPMCKFFAQGYCAVGDACKWSHETKAKDNAEDDDSKVCEPCTAEEQDAQDTRTCMICYEDIVRKGMRFGILSDCDHVFCLDCIKTWRKDGCGSATHKRTCPTCRTTSNFFMPHFEYVKGEKKHKVIEGYKKRLAVIPCRYFNNGEPCPFRSECFYAHIYEDGEDRKQEEGPAKIGQRRRRGREGVALLGLQIRVEQLNRLMDGDPDLTRLTEALMGGVPPSDMGDAALALPQPPSAAANAAAAAAAAASATGGGLPHRENQQGGRGGQ
mmetsp:Transcript_43721/g.137299  ORF Transcript_43721/g.137299 Transcript_43721/m.137299 type:complete len:297 (-) Transcript_43721:756-1646(-)